MIFNRRRTICIRLRLAGLYHIGRFDSAVSGKSAARNADRSPESKRNARGVGQGDGLRSA
jgi:hypothetical protein